MTRQDIRFVLLAIFGVTFFNFLLATIVEASGREVNWAFGWATLWIGVACGIAATFFAEPMNSQSKTDRVPHERGSNERSG